MGRPSAEMLAPLRPRAVACSVVAREAMSAGPQQPCLKSGTVRSSSRTILAEKFTPSRTVGTRSRPRVCRSRSTGDAQALARWASAIRTCVSRRERSLISTWPKPRKCSRPRAVDGLRAGAIGSSKQRTKSRLTGSMLAKAPTTPRRELDGVAERAPMKGATENCTAEASVSIAGTTYDLPMRKGTLGPEVVDVSTLYQAHRALHLRPGLHLHGKLRVEDHVHRLRQGNSTLSRLPDRTTRRAQHLS